jgi:hypothetical protein
MTSWIRLFLASLLLAGIRLLAVGEPRPCTPAELVSDEGYLFSVLEEVHPDLYARVPKAEMDAARRAWRQSLLVPQTRLEAWLGLAPLVAMLGDGHTQLAPPTEEFQAFRARGGLAFPLRVGFDPLDALRIERVYGPVDGLAPGDRLLRINGLDADSLARILLDRMSGESTAFRRFQLAKLFRGLVWMVGIQPPFLLEAEASGDGRHVTATAPGVTQTQVVVQDSLLSIGSPKADWRFQRLDDGAGLLEFNTMIDGRAFGEFLRAIFQEIHDRPVTGLIIDLRANGGGRLSLGDSLLRHLTDRPYMMFEREEWKISASYKRQLRRQIPAWARWMPSWMLSGGPEAYYLRAPVGSLWTIRRAVMPPLPTSLRFDGPVCFLMGPGTYSSAVMLADAVKEFQLATLIGEETGGWPNSFGQAYSFTLPSTGLIARASTARFVRPRGDASRKGGVLPDVVVDAARRDGPDGDPALARARQWIRDRGEPAMP